MKPTDEQYRAVARRKYEQEGTIEIDNDAPVSHSDDGGAYIQAWVWIYDDELKP